MPDWLGLKGRVALVTGATRGNGFAIAEGLAGAGARVVVTSRSAADADRVAKMLQKKHGFPCLGLACDVSRRDQVKLLFRRIAAWKRGPVEVLVNNAGHAVVSEWWEPPLHEFEEAELERAMRAVAAVDLDGARWCTYYALPGMIRRGRGSIVFTSSTPALTGYKGTPYTEAKAALLGLMRDVAREYGPQGIRANAIAPGNIRTEWLEKIAPAERRRLEQENALRRFGEPEEIARVVLFLASDLSSFVTGETLIVDGGTLIR